MDSFTVDILDQYRQISNKLKKRFLRKPNVTEACDSFFSLGQLCESQELPAYAGLCWIAAARCEGSLTNIPGETSCLLRAARQFLSAENNDRILGCPSPSKENLQAALGCYAYASNRCPPEDSTPFNVGINLEIVNFLKENSTEWSIEDQLLDAIEHCDENNLDTKIHCLELLATNHIRSADYVSALNVFTEITQILGTLPVNGARSSILLRCEINILFLLLILKPAPQKLAASSAKLLEKYTWGDKNDTTLKACGMTEKMFVLLQSLVAVCQSMDTENLTNLEGDLWPLLGKEERELLRILVKMYNH